MALPRPLEIALLALALCLAGCPSSSAGPAAEAIAPPAIRLDGRVDPEEWGSEALRADGRDVFVRLSLPEPLNLQAADQSVVVLIDADGDPASGTGLDYVQGDTDVGAEIAIVYSPPGGQPRFGGRSREGVAFLLLSDETGSPKPVAHEAFDFLGAPTVASDEFELRFSRQPAGLPEIGAALASGRITVHVLAVARDASLLWSKSLGSLELPPLAGGGQAARVPVRLPERRADAARVVSWNVLFASPAKKPAPFARILRALDPDVVLVQEWERASAADLEAWFETNLGTDWNAIDSPGWGVAVVARGPLARLGPARVARPTDAPPDQTRPDEVMRLAAALAQTRVGPLAVASIHLKCCGAADSPEDRARVAEAKVIRETLKAALGTLGDRAPALRIFGGDLNLVGSSRPLAELATGLAAGGGDLDVAEAGVLGDRATYTWRGAGSRFPPGRLDYLLYGGGEVLEAFVLDSRRLPKDVLRETGIEREDSAASDHLALVVDVRPSPAGSVTEPP